MKSWLTRRARGSTVVWVLIFVLRAFGQGPSVQKLDPPNWWAGFAPKVMVLAHGENLAGARVETSYPGVRVVRSETSGNGHYLFLWLEIAPTAVPGDVTFQISTPPVTRGGSKSYPAVQAQGLKPSNLLAMDGRPEGRPFHNLLDPNQSRRDSGVSFASVEGNGVSDQTLSEGSMRYAGELPQGPKPSNLLAMDGRPEGRPFHNLLDPNQSRPDPMFSLTSVEGNGFSGPSSREHRPSSSQGSFRWPLLKREPQAGRFHGITKDDVLYLIMPDRFADGDTSNDQPGQSPGTYDRGAARAYHGGDLRGIREHLDYLKDLGVTAIWLNPVYDNDNHSPEDYHGYGAVDFYAVDEHLGTLQEFQELVAAAHERGMKIVLDVVVNHTGPRHPWVGDLPQPDWFHGTPEKHRESKGTFGPLTDPHALRVQYADLLDGWFADKLPDLKQENPAVTEYLIDNNLWWAETAGLDAFRLDTFPYVPRAFWSEWHKALFEVYPQMTTVGEVFNPDPTITSFFVGGEKRFDGIDTRLPAVFDFPMYETLRAVLNHDAPARRLVEVLQRDWMYPRAGSLVTFIGNHDTTRFFTNAGESTERLENAFSLLLTMRGIPQIYSGDEIAMPGGEDPDNRRDFPGGFPGDKRNAFTAAGRTAAEQEVFARVQGLLRLRKVHRALREGRQVHLECDDTSYVFLRELEADRVVVVFNDGGAIRKFAVDLRDANMAGVGAAEGVLGAPPAKVENSTLTVEAPAHSVSVYVLH